MLALYLMLSCSYLLCSKLCWHNRLVPTNESPQYKTTADWCEISSPPPQEMAKSMEGEEVIYRKRGKIHWAKLSRFSRTPRKFYREIHFIIQASYIMALF